MPVTITHPLDELQLEDLQGQGYISLKLYKSDTPDGEYTDSGVTPSPATLADAESGGVPYEFVFQYSNGNPSQWFKVVAYDGSSISSLKDSEAFHGGGGTTLTTLRQRLGKYLGVMHVGVTTAIGGVGGSSAVADTPQFARFRDDHFGGGNGVDGWFFYNLDNDEWSLVSDWVQSTRTFSFSPSLGTQVGSSSNFEVMCRWTPDEFRDAINWAIVYSFPYLSKVVVDYSFLTEEDTFQYPVPNNMKSINKVEISSNTNETSVDLAVRGHPWRQIPFEEVGDNLNRILEFKREMQEERRIRVTGTAMLSQLHHNDDYVEVVDPQVDLIVYLAAHFLYAKLSNTAASTDVARYRDQATYYMNLYLENRGGKRVGRRRSKRIWGHDAKWARY